MIKEMMMMTATTIVLKMTTGLEYNQDVELIVVTNRAQAPMMIVYLICRIEL